MNMHIPLKSLIIISHNQVYIMMTLWNDSTGMDLLTTNSYLQLTLGWPYTDSAIYSNEADRGITPSGTRHCQNRWINQLKMFQHISLMEVDQIIDFS